MGSWQAVKCVAGAWQLVGCRLALRATKSGWRSAVNCADWDGAKGVAQLPFEADPWIIGSWCLPGRRSECILL